MSTSLALFALFTIGSAVVPCGQESTHVGDACTDNKNYIGNCAGYPGSVTCTLLTAKCTTGAVCKEGTLRGKCETGDKCKYSPTAPCGQLVSNVADPCTDSSNYIGQCTGSTANNITCAKLTGTCNAGTACMKLPLRGVCETDDNCKHTPAMVPCVKTRNSCVDKDGIIGMCTGSGASMQCIASSIDTCVTGKTPCEQEPLQGECSLPEQCKYIPPMVPCVKDGASCADSYGSIGTCNASMMCTLSNKCNAQLNGKRCAASNLAGACEANKCKYIPLMVACATDDSCVDSYGFIGTCATADSVTTCTAKSVSCPKGNGCKQGNLMGMCVDSDQCKYLPPVVSCSANLAPCADSYGHIGKCNASLVCEAGSSNCGTKGDPCSEGTLKGLCLDGPKCKYTPPAAPCASTSAGTVPCTDENNHIGLCTGGGSTTCNVMGECTANAACAQSLLKGKCNGAGDKCQHDPLVSPCVQTWGSGGACTDSSNFIGKCGGTAGSMTCALSSMCPNDESTCEEGSLKGICVEGDKCKYTPPMAPCVLTSSKSDPCTDNAGFIGVCATGVIGSLSCKPITCVTGACQQGSDLQGMCMSAQCKYVASVKVEYSVQSTENKNPVVAKVLTHTEFPAQLKDTFGSREASKPMTICAPMPTDPNGTFGAKCNEPTGDCALSCNIGYKVKGKHDLTCDKDTFQWKGTRGVCTTYCKIAGVDKLDGYVEESGKIQKDIDNGTLHCPHIFPGVQCTLKCKAGYRVQAAPTRMCDSSTQKWPGIDGVCGPTVDISASVHVVLKDSDSHHLITALGDDAFNRGFRDSVSTLTGVLPENILITKITLVTSSNGRRLAQRSVLVDYTVQMGATDLDKVDGTDSPADDGRLPVGGGLRGIP